MQAERRGMETKFLNSQKIFNSKIDLVPSLC